MYAKAFDNQALATIRNWVAKAERIVLTAHLNADGDACGSLLGCTHLMDRYAKNAQSIVPILPTGCPENFRWLPGADRIVAASDGKAGTRMAEADLLVCLDLNTPDRMEPLDQAFRHAKGHKLLVDHPHNPATGEFDLIVSDHSISSTCELMHWLAQALWGEDCLTPEAAVCLSTGLRTDTGTAIFSDASTTTCGSAAGILEVPTRSTAWSFIASR